MPKNIFISSMSWIVLLCPFGRQQQPVAAFVKVKIVFYIARNNQLDMETNQGFFYLISLVYELLQNPLYKPHFNYGRK